MAIYHLSAKIISRSNGGSAVAAAAYRSADKLNNYQTNETYNYKRKQSVDYTEIFLPKNAPAEFWNREILWNSVEQCEKQKNAQLAREIDFALPIELNFEQQKSLARNFARIFARQGMCVDLSFHDKKNNPHCHLLLTLRGLDKNGNWLPKCKKVGNKRVNLNNWNDKETLEKWRKDWEFFANVSLSNAGVKERIDHRSFKKQGVEKIPTIHLGKSANAMEKSNQLTERGNINREIQQLNLFNEKIKPTLEKYSNAIKKVPPTDDLHTFYLWHYLAIKHIQQEQEKLLQEKEVEIENLKKIAIKNTEEFKKLQEVENRTKNYCKDYYNLQDQRTKLAIKKWELENSKPEKSIFFGLGTTEKYKNWKKELRDINDQLKQNDDQTESAENIMRLSEQELDNARLKLDGKRYSLTVSSSKTIELDSKINELKKDETYLVAIQKKLYPKLLELSKKNPYFKNFNNQRREKDKIRYSDFIRLDKHATTNLKNFDTSATFVRQLRLAEQQVQSPSFLADLNKTLAEPLTDSNTSMPVAVACLSSDNAFDMPFKWNLISEIKQQKIKADVGRLI